MQEGMKVEGKLLEVLQGEVKGEVQGEMKGEVKGEGIGVGRRSMKI